MTRTISLLVATMWMSACSAGHLPGARLADDDTTTPPAPVVAAPDITVAFSGAAQVEGGKIRFALALTNVGGAMTAELPIKSKAMLFPKANYEMKLVGTGIVLETVATSAMLGEGETTIVNVEQTLPNVPKGSYYLGATTNTEQSAFKTVVPEGTVVAPHLVETYDAQMNNVTEKLADLGELENVVVLTEPKGKYDLGHEVQNAAISLDAGTAQHSSRNILRMMIAGEDKIPEKKEWQDTISARFLFADLENGTLAMGAYHKSAIDKVWFGISWNKEKDAAGHNIVVDYYSNAPIIKKLKPGKYLLGVLMNVNDAFKLDAYPENNLDLTYMALDKQKMIKTNDEVWMSVNDGTTGYVSSNIYNRADTHEWTFSIENQPAWLKVTGKRSSYSYRLTCETTGLDVPLGMHEIPVKITATKDGETFETTSMLRIFKNSGPVLSTLGAPADGKLRLETPGVTITEYEGVKTMHYSFRVQNAGNEKLYYTPKDTAEILKIEAPGMKVLDPGEAHEIKISLALVGTPIPRDDGTTAVYFSIDINSNGGTRTVDLYFEQGTPNPSNDGNGDDDDGSGDDDDDDDGDDDGSGN